MSTVYWVFNLIGLVLILKCFNLIFTVLLFQHSDDVDRLSSAVLAAASMLHPFHWQHIFIPLLPSRLLDYASAPLPYIIGVRRYLLPKLNMSPEAMGDVLIVDADR